MAINKVEYNGKTLIDLTNDTVTDNTLIVGATAHSANGERIVGTFDPTIYLEKTGNASNVTTAFTQATVRANIATGEALAISMGKIAKNFADIKGHAFEDTVNNLTTTVAGNALDATQGKALSDTIAKNANDISMINNNLQEQIDYIKSFVGYESSDIYGVEVDFVKKKFTRLAGAENLTAGADFDKLNPWGGRKRCILADDGTVLAYRGETGYTEAGATTVELKKTVDGAEKTYASGTKVQVMVEQPVFYVKAVPVSSKNATSGKGKQYTKGRFYISPTPKAGFTAPRAFYDNHGIIQDKIYLSAFEGCIYDTDANKYLTADEQVADFATDMLSSIAGAKPASGLKQNLTRANVRKLCANRGAGWESHSIFAMAVTEWLLMIEYASLDAQRKVGRGVCDFTDDGKTNMAVVTGATSGLGNGSGIDPNGGVDGKCSVSYRGEENLWGNIWTLLDKVNILAKGLNEVFVHEIGATVADDTTTGYKSLGYHWSHSDGYQSAFGIDPEHPELLIPTEASRSDVFTGNFVWQNYTYNGFLIAMLGGRWGMGSSCGFALSGNSASGGHARVIGGRLLYVPQTKVA